MTFAQHSLIVLPSASAALRAFLASSPTGHESKVQFANGKRGKIPYPPAAFPPVPSSCINEIPALQINIIRTADSKQKIVPVTGESSEIYPACLGTVSQSMPTWRQLSYEYDPTSGIFSRDAPLPSRAAQQNRETRFLHSHHSHLTPYR